MSAASTRRRRAPARAGFTLVEIMVSFILLAVGLLAVAGLALTAARTVRSGSTQTVAAAMAQARFDSLASHRCDLVVPVGQIVRGTMTHRGIREVWVAVDGRHASVGQPFVIQLVDSLFLPNRQRPVVQVTYLPCRR